jgi:hypothetical protein
VGRPLWLKRKRGTKPIVWIPLEFGTPFGSLFNISIVNHILSRLNPLQLAAPSAQQLVPVRSPKAGANWA